MIEELKINIEQEKRIITEINYLLMQISNVEPVERSFYVSSLSSLKEQLKMLNNAIPVLVNELSPVKSLNDKKEKARAQEQVVRVSYVSPSTKEKRFITINKGDREKFLKELSLSESGLDRISKSVDKNQVLSSGVSKPSKLARISSIFFGKLGDGLAGGFSDVKKDLSEANIRFNISTYLSIALFVSFIVFLFSGAVMGVLISLNISSLMWVWIPFALLFLCLMGFYFYPAIEKGSFKGRISHELPFATIYMSAIAGSNIEPTRIFSIVANSSEYPSVGVEFKKVVNQVEIYGYDLVSVLKKAAITTPNKKLAELFSGLATNIVSGGSLKEYLEKKSENLLTDYKLLRQEYTSIAGTFMDVYISILVTAPLVLMMLFVIMNLTGFTTLTMPIIMLLAIGGVALVNILFMIVLQLKQPPV